MKTVGLSPKVPTQAVVSIIVFALTYFGFQVSPEVAAAIATLLGAAGGWFANPGQVEPE